MVINNGIVDKTEETSAEFKSSGKSSCYGNVKNIIADKLHNVAEVLDEKSTDQDVQCCMAQCGKHISEWLERSSEYVRQFDYKQAGAGVREYVKQNPGRSIIIAGAVGLIIGAVWRRR
jgi:ElaB/YqjD/DUF883 family membrane-anchored ribosome-binding protein